MPPLNRAIPQGALLRRAGSPGRRLVEVLVARDDLAADVARQGAAVRADDLVALQTMSVRLKWLVMLLTYPIVLDKGWRVVREPEIMTMNSNHSRFPHWALGQLRTSALAVRGLATASAMMTSRGTHTLPPQRDAGCRASCPLPSLQDPSQRQRQG